MSLINFKKACRSCNTTNGLNNIIIDMENEVDYYKNLTDLNVSTQISNSLRNNGSSCEFCGANNFDIYNINVDDYNIFNLNSLKVKHNEKGLYIYVFNMTKINNMAEMNIDSNDLRKNDYDDQKKFELRCKNELQKYITQIPSHNLIHDENGVFYVCFTGNDIEVKIQKLRFCGFTKEALLNISNHIGKGPFD